MAIKLENIKKTNCTQQNKGTEASAPKKQTLRPWQSYEPETDLLEEITSRKHSRKDAKRNRTQQTPEEKEAELQKLIAKKKQQYFKEFL